jgi:hypothetical protein
MERYQHCYCWNIQGYIVSATGCDSVATLVLTVNPVVTSTTNTTICSSALPYTWNGINITTAGTYKDTLVSATGCDSCATLDTVRQPSRRQALPTLPSVLVHYLTHGTATASQRLELIKTHSLLRQVVTLWLH